MKKIQFGLMVAVGLLATGCSKYNKANIEYSKMSYYKASNYYADYLKNHDKPKAMLRLADSYRQMHDFAKAEYWYAKAISGTDAKVADKLSYAMVLKANGKYAEAKEWFGKYLIEMPNDEIAKALMVSCDSMDSYNSTASQFKTEALRPSSTVSNFSMVPYEKGYVFCSEANTDGNKQKTNPWNGRPYLNLVYARMSAEGKMEEPQPFSPSINSAYHNGPVAFSPNFDRIYFCQSNLINNKLKKSTTDENNIKMYTAQRIGQEWMEVTEMPFNSNEYSTGHPALSTDGTTMFFVSDRPGGNGKTDIYMSSNVNGSWSEPQSLGGEINTSGNEMFPTYYKTKEGSVRLYFSSDGREGMGGLDIYYSQQKADGTWGAPVHLGAPFNSSKDDFGMMLKNDNAGYFTSSRNGNGDVDQLFAFEKAIPVNFFAEGIVLNRNTMEAVPNAQIVVTNKTIGRNDVIYAKEDGRFFMSLDKNSEYEFNVARENYLPGNAITSTMGKTVSETLQVRMFLDSVGYVLSLANVYYDFDKWNIRRDAGEQLDKLAEILKRHPEVMLALDAHTDKRGSEEYNMVLSQKRANSVIRYLVSRGIEKKRLHAKWHGKQMPATACPEDVVCSPDVHQSNRRTEFKIVNEYGNVVKVYSNDRFSSK